MKKIAILGLHLGYGGVEQSIVNQANMLCETYEVELVITYHLFEAPYKINPKVNVIYLTDLKPNKQELKECIQKKHVIKALWEGMKSIYILHMRTSCVKKYIRKTDADIIISSRVLYTRLLGKYAKKEVIKIAEEHCHHNQNAKYIETLKQACKNIDYLLPVSKELTDDYQKLIQNGQTKCLFLPNSLEYWPEEEAKLDAKNLISIGRISKEKGFLDLIDVFHIVHETYPEWKLNIIGDGDLMPELKRKIEEKNLKDSVVLHGFQKKDYIYNMLQKSSIYVMSSYEESFGIVLIEAASFGIPLIAMESARGALEIIEPEKNGYLIENRDIGKMAKQIEYLIENENVRIELGKNAKESVKQYSFDNVKEKWLAFLSSLED